MQQKERDELQRYLDDRIFGTKRQRRSEYANRNLTQGQKDVLYQVVKDIRNLDMDKNKVKSAVVLDNELKTVATCLRQLNFHNMKPNPKNSKNIVPRDKMPFLVKQVLWLICYKALQAGLDQKDVFEELEQYDIYVSHNFFSSLELTPDYYLRCEGHQQPENPCKYKGQKKDQLAVAIKNLVYQAGKHSCFVDIFGGSGSATAAVCRKRRVSYVYNEKNKAVYNYINMIKGDTYKEIKKGLQNIQDDLASPDNNTYSSYMQFNISEEIGRYIKSKQVRNNKEKDIINLEREIQGYGDVDFKIDGQRLAQLMQCFPNEIQNHKTEIEELLKQEKVFRGISSFKQLAKMNTVNDFYRYEEVFNYLSSHYLPLWGLQWAKGMYGFDEITYEDWRKMLRQYKALGYYAYFYLLRKKGGNGVVRAVGEIFLWYFSVQGSIVSSAIIYDLRGELWGGIYSEIYKFINEDFKHKVKEFYDALSGTIVENMDFRGIIQKYSTENTLFYSDSPYIGTSDYDDVVGGVSKFSGADMKDLIRGIIWGLKTSMQKDTKKASKPNKFIFSMRAVISSESNQNEDDIKEKNASIYENVYKEFMSYKTPLYVLVICEKGTKLEYLIKRSKVVEIMITNFEIKGFNVDWKDKSYTCEVYSFETYIDIIRKLG